jgi:hypothetical protein
LELSGIQGYPIIGVIWQSELSGNRSYPAILTERLQRRIKRNQQNRLDSGHYVSDIQTYIQTCRHTEIQTDIQTYIQTCRHTEIQTDIQTCRHTEIQTDIQTCRQTCRHTEIQTDVETCRQTYRQTDERSIRKLIASWFKP